MHPSVWVYVAYTFLSPSTVAYKRVAYKKWVYSKIVKHEWYSSPTIQCHFDNFRDHTRRPLTSALYISIELHSVINFWTSKLVLTFQSTLVWRRLGAAICHLRPEWISPWKEFSSSEHTYPSATADYLDGVNFHITVHKLGVK